VVSCAGGFETDALDEVGDNLVEDADGVRKGGFYVAVAIEELGHWGWLGWKREWEGEVGLRSLWPKFILPTFLPARARGSILRDGSEVCDERVTRLAMDATFDLQTDEAEEGLWKLI